MRETSNTLQHQNSLQPKQFRGGEKKVMKKSFVSAALAASLVIPAAVPAFAATTPSDVVGTSVQSAVEELTALGIIEGYTDGTFKPENSITRAELAKIIVIATGYEASATSMQNTTPIFSDVKVNEWYTGYINAAVAKGYIQGYNGKYRPNDTVKFEEVAAIMVRALGYKESRLTGSWPYNYIVAGQDADLFDGLTIATGTAANRGTVAQMTSNALNADVVEYNEAGNLRETGEKLIDSLGDSEEFLLTSATVDDGEINLDGKDYDVADNFVVTGGDKLVDLLGHTVSALRDDAGDILAIYDDQDDDLVLETETDGAYTVGDGITVADGEENYVFASESYVFLNGEELDEGDTIDDETTITLYLNEDDKVVAAVATDWESDLVVSSVDKDENEVDTKNGGVYELADSAIITVNGKAATLSDLKEFDIIEILADSDNKAIKIDATRESVSGELESISEDKDGDLEYTVEGKEYDVVDNDFEQLKDSDVGEEYTFYLNADGEVAAFDATNAVDNSDFGVVYSVTEGTYVVDGEAPDGGKNYKIKYYSIADGKDVTTYTTDVTFATYENHLLEIFYDDDNIPAFKGEDGDEDPEYYDLDRTGEVDEVDSDSLTVNYSTGKTEYKLSGSTLYFTYDVEDGEIKAAEADDVTENDEVAVYSAGTTTAQYVFITDNNNAEDELDQVQGLYVDRSKRTTSDDTFYYLTLNVKGTDKKYEVEKAIYDAFANTAENTIVTLKATDEGVYEEAPTQALGNGSTDVSYDSADRELTVAGTTYLVTSNTQIYTIAKGDLTDADEADVASSSTIKTAVQSIKDGDDDYVGIIVVGSGAVPGRHEEAGVVIVVKK
ncbi:S-layer homology domain-containing protein [Paenibacillus thailandensis]|uniref:S-layer homology domain-containing protein n=1 Tax=Paenibacillus thailandensis TaxID=393250 RepID=A0ABW5R3J4_9BACL